jgi:hypothetical protein
LRLERNQDGATPKLNSPPSTPFRSGKTGVILASIWGILAQKGLKNTRKGAKIGEFQLPFSKQIIFVIHSFFLAYMEFRVEKVVQLQ